MDLLACISKELCSKGGKYLKFGLELDREIFECKGMI